MKPRARKTHRVSISDFVEGDAIAFQNRTWNGWACRLFDKKGADALVVAWRATGGTAYYDRETDSYVFCEAEHDEPDSFPSRMHKGIKVWPIGAGCWVWWRD